MVKWLVRCFTFESLGRGAGLFTPGDWTCTSCGNVNWARRSTCNQCNAPKPGTVDLNREGQGGGFKASVPPFSGPCSCPGVLSTCIPPHAFRHMHSVVILYTPCGWYWMYSILHSGQKKRFFRKEERIFFLPSSTQF